MYLIRMAGQRIAAGVLTLLVISALLFFSIEALPGDPARAVLGQTATPETIAAFRKEAGLDRPVLVRYGDWLASFVAGDLGRSLASRRDISGLIGDRLFNTLILAAVTALFAVPLSIILGVASAVWRGTLLDRLISTVSLAAISVPEFFIGYILLAIVAVQLNLLPSISSVHGGMSLAQWVPVLVLPCLTMAMAVSAHMIRMTRAALVDVMSSSFIEMARLKGLSNLRIVFRHALPNAVSPICSVVFLNIAYLIVGVVVVEVVFVYPGLGQLLVDSVAKRDFPVVQATCLIFATANIALNIISDILGAASNPRSVGR